MDFKELMRIAAENKQRARKECVENKRYNTNIPPPKKEQKTVDPKAIRARLLSKEQLKKEKAAEEEKKKQELLKLRAAAQAGKKGKGKKDGSTTKSSSKETPRTKPEDADRRSSTSKHSRERYEDDEHESRHKSFMEKVDKVAKKSRDDHEREESPEPVKKTSAPSKKTSAPKGPMSYEDLLKLAANRQKSSSQPGPSPNSEKQIDDNAYRTNKFSSSFHKNHRDKNDKHPVIGNGHLKEAAEKYKKGAKKESVQSSSSKKQDHDQRPVIGNGRLKQAAEKYKPKTSQSDSGRPSSSKQSHSTPKQLPNSKNSVQSKITEHTTTIKTKGAKSVQSKITEHTTTIKTSKGATPSKEPRSSQSEPRRSVETPAKKQSKTVVNERERHMPADKDRRKQMVGSKERNRQSPPEKYRERPHSTHMDRDRPRSSGAEFRRPVAKKRPAPPPRMKAKHGRLLSDDESDYEEDGFIDDTPMDEGGPDVSSYIKEIFGYDKSKFGYESDYALRFMDASYKDIAREEARSARLGMLEDLEDMRKEKEDEMRMRKAKAKAKKGKR